MPSKYMQSSRSPGNGWVLLLYTLLSILLTLPLAAHLSTHVPGDGVDDPSLAWNLWWLNHRLVEQLQFDIFHVDWLFFPIEINLAFYTLTPLNGLLSVPLQNALNLVIANNLILLSSYVLAGFGAYLLAKQELSEWQATSAFSSSSRLVTLSALFAGLVYAFSSSKLFYASLGQFNIASSQWLPFCVLYLMRLGRSRHHRAAMHNALMTGLFFAFQAWAELTYASFLLIFMLLWLLWQLLSRRWTWAELQRLAVALLLLGSVMVVSLLPFLAAMLPDLQAEGNFWSSGGGFADIFSADLFGYLVPTRLHPLFGTWIDALSFPNDKAQHIFIGYSAMALLLTAVLAKGSGAKMSTAQGRRTLTLTWFWLTNVFLFFLLSLGPHLRWLGRDLPLTGPFALVSQLPFFSGNRYPSRYAVMLMLCVAVLASRGVFVLMRRVESGDWRPETGDRRLETGDWKVGVLRGGMSGLCAPMVVIVVCLCFLFEHLVIPLPLSDFRVPPIYQRIAETPGDFTVLELPTGWRNGARELGKPDELIMMQQWYQTFYEARRLGGNTSRNPAFKFQYFTDAPLIGDWIALMNADQWWMTAEADAQLPAMIERGKRQAASVLAFLHVKYVTVHVDKTPPQLLAYIEQALPLTKLDEWQGADWNGVPSTIRLYEVNPLPPSPSEIDLRDPDTVNLHRGDSRTSARMSLPSATWLLDLPPETGEVSLLVSEYAELSLTLNGKLLTRAVPFAARTPEQVTVDAITFTIPAGGADPLMDRLVLNADGAPASFAMRMGKSSASSAPLLIGQTGQEWLGPGLTVRSAGADVGDFASIRLGEREVAVNEMGYNLVALSATGELLESVVFANLQDASQLEPMRVWLSKWPPSTVIAGAVADEASFVLMQEDETKRRELAQPVIDALQTVGVAMDLRGRFRWSHAFVGVVGAPLGSALEDTALFRPAEVMLSQESIAPPVYAVVESIRYRPAVSSSSR